MSFDHDFENDEYIIKNFNIDLLDPETCILDCNNGEKLITEMNNYICLGQYEIARTFFKQIVEIIPVYMKYFYKIIFTRGIPNKWLLSNQIRTSANYIWILYQDYKNELENLENFPKIGFSEEFLKANEFDLLITTAFYNSYEILTNFEMNLEFLKDLRNIYNYFACLKYSLNFYLPKLRILSPDVSLKGLNLTIEECYYEFKEDSKFEFSKLKNFFDNLKNFIITQPILSKQVIIKILANCTEMKPNNNNNNINSNSNNEAKNIQEIFQIIYVDLIMLYVHSLDYHQVYEYLKYIPFNNDIEFCKSYVLLLFSVLVALSHNNDYDPDEVLKFTAYVVKHLKLDSKNQFLSNFKKLEYFSKETCSYARVKSINPTKDHEKWMLKHKIFEAILANSNKKLLTNLHVVEDLYITYLSDLSQIPSFFHKYSLNMEKENFFENLSYEEMKSLISAYSKFENSMSIEFTNKIKSMSSADAEMISDLEKKEKNVASYVNILNTSDSKYNNNNNNNNKQTFKNNKSDSENFKINSGDETNKENNSKAFTSKISFINKMKFFWNIANNNIFWNEYLNFLRVYQEHCLGYVLRQSINYVEKQKFDTAVMLLHPLNNLKLLLILFVWDKFENDISSRKEILEIFWKSYLKYRDPLYKSYTLVPYFEDIIINLDYIINFSMWIQNKLEKLDINADSNNIYSELLIHSIPFVTKNYLVEFKFEEMLVYFQERFPISNKKLQKNHFHSMMIIFSFFFYDMIIKKIEDHFNNLTESNNENPLFSEKDKDDMVKVLNKIILVPYRLNIMADIFNLIFIRIKDFLENIREKENLMEATQTGNFIFNNSQFLYQKKIFIEIVKFLKSIMSPLERFDFSNLNSIFKEDFLDKDICSMLQSVENKEIFLEDLVYIDTDYISCLESQKDLSYKNFLVMKSQNLKNNVDEIIFRFNIVDNPWLEIIYENNIHNSFLSTILQNNKHYFQVSKKFHMWKIAEEVVRFFNLPYQDYHRNEIDLLKYFSSLKDKLTKLEDDKEFKVEGLIDFAYLEKLLMNDIAYQEKNKLSYFKDGYPKFTLLADSFVSLNSNSKELSAGSGFVYGNSENILSNYSVLSKEENNFSAGEVERENDKDLEKAEEGQENELYKQKSLESLNANSEEFANEENNKNKDSIDTDNIESIESPKGKEVFINKIKTENSNQLNQNMSNNNNNPNNNNPQLINIEKITDPHERHLLKGEMYKQILNFEYFKILFDLSLTEHISPHKSTVLMDKAILFLAQSIEKGNERFTDIVDKYKMFIDPNLSKEQREESLCKMVVSTKNVSSVPISCGPILIRSHLKFLSNHREALKALIEKVNQNKSEDLSYEELNKYFSDAYGALLKYEAYSEGESVTTIKINKSMNYLKNFLNYLIKVGDIYHNARIKYKKNGSNYLRILKKYPKEIIAKLFLKYNSEKDAVTVAKMTKTDLIWVILEFTDYYKKSIINYNEFNNYFNELLNLYESQKINPNKLESHFSNFENLYVKEEWVKGNPKKTFPLTMRILEYVYELSYDPNEAIEEYNHFVPLFVSLYRIDFDSLSDEEQVKFWNLLIEKYSGVKIFNNYIKMIFTKFYFYKTFYQKNTSFKHLYEKINNLILNNNDSNNAVNHIRSSKNINNNNEEEDFKQDKIEEEKILKIKKDILLNEKTNNIDSFQDKKIEYKEEYNNFDEEVFTNNHDNRKTNFSNKYSSKNIFNPNSQKEKNDIHKKLYDKLFNPGEFNKMLPKTFSFIPTTNEYKNKLNSNLLNYLSTKLNNKANGYSNLYRESNTFNNQNSNNDFSNSNLCKSEFTKQNKGIKDSKLNIKFTDIQNLSCRYNMRFYENLCRGLLEEDQYDLALEILDDTKTDVIQILINEIVKNTKEEEKLYKLLIRMKDKKKVFEYTKIYWYDWKPETTITILRLIKDEYGMNQDEISNMIKKLKVFYSIIKRNVLPEITLQKLEENCNSNIEDTLAQLMAKNSHDLCYKLLKVYNKFDQYKNVVKFSEIKLLLSTNDIKNKILALEKLSEVNERKIHFCSQLIKELNNYKNKLLIIKYLLENYLDKLAEEDKNYLINQKIAIKVFFLIPKDLQEKLIHLINTPELIIETLLINLRFNIINTIFSYFPQLESDNLITFYAQKAMSFSKINKNNDCLGIKASLKNQKVELVILTNENREQIIFTHDFPTAPDFNLFVKFMDICKDINIIAKVCFDVSNNCSKYLLEKNPTQPKILFINFISKVLNYLEDRLKNYDDSKTDKNEMKVINNKLYTYEKLVELFKEFLYQGIDDLIDLELNKFYEEEDYKLTVRDKLIDNDYLNLAEKYCVELNINSSRVDLELGLFSLKNRNFCTARKGFEKILYSNSIIKNSSSSLSDSEHYDVVNQIINILQGSFNLRIDELEKIHIYLLFRLSCKIIPNEEKTLNILDRYRELKMKKLKESVEDLSYSEIGLKLSKDLKLKNYIDVILLDEYLKREKQVIINETSYYVKKYGTSIQLLNFYIDNDMLGDTIDYILINRVPLDVFTEEVVKKCFKKKQMMYSLCSSLQKVYTQNKYALDLILEVINFLKKENAHQELINLYVLMNDYLEAALEAILIIKKTEDVIIKLSYYIKAAQNLNEYLNMHSNSKLIHIYDRSVCDAEGHINLSSQIQSNNSNSNDFTGGEPQSSIINLNSSNSNSGNNNLNLNNQNAKTHLNAQSTSNNREASNNALLLNNTGLSHQSNHQINSNGNSNAAAVSSLNNASSMQNNNKRLDRKIDRSSLQRLLTLLNFQIDVLNLKKDIKFTLITDDEEDRYSIIQEIITLDSDLALAIIKEYKLKVNEIFIRATREYISKHNFAKFNLLLEIFNKWKMDGLFKRIAENESELWNNILIQAISLIPLEDEELRLNIKQYIIPYFTDDYCRMYAYLLIDELENAFILALQLKNNDVMQEVKNKAYEKKDLHVIELVEKYNMHNN